MGAEATGNNLKYDQYLEFRSQVFRYLGGELIVTFSTAANLDKSHPFIRESIPFLTAVQCGKDQKNIPIRSRVA